MDDLIKEIARVQAIENEVKSGWIEVFLKSGQSMWVMAEDFDVRPEVVQEREEDDGELVWPEIKYDQLCFYDGDGDRIAGFFIPYENVEAIRIWGPPADEEDEEEGDEEE